MYLGSTYVYLDPPNLTPQSSVRVEWDGTNPEKSGGSKRGKDGTAAPPPQGQGCPVSHLPSKESGQPAAAQRPACLVDSTVRAPGNPTLGFLLHREHTDHTGHTPPLPPLPPPRRNLLQHHHVWPKPVAPPPTPAHPYLPHHDRSPILQRFVEPAREQTFIAHPSSFLDEQASIKKIKKDQAFAKLHRRPAAHAGAVTVSIWPPREMCSRCRREDKVAAAWRLG